MGQERLDSTYPRGQEPKPKRLKTHTPSSSRQVIRLADGLGIVVTADAFLIGALLLFVVMFGAVVVVVGLTVVVVGLVVVVGFVVVVEDEVVEEVMFDDMHLQHTSAPGHLELHSCAYESL
ncbi:MAG: hypothetical protein ACTSV6_06260 [Candidatus Heimdallarchaeota archaeon]